MGKLKIKVGKVQFDSNGKKCHIEVREGKKVLAKTNEICSNKKEKVKETAWNEVLQIDCAESTPLVVGMYKARLLLFCEFY